MSFVPGRNRPAPSATVLRVEKGEVVLGLASRQEIVLNLRRPDCFDVARARQIEVSPGDKILIRANDKRLGLTNGQILTMAGVVYKDKPEGSLGKQYLKKDAR